METEMEFKFEKFNEPIIAKKNFSISNHKIFKKYSSELYQKYTFELLETLCNKSNYEHKTKILYKSIYFLLKFLYKSKNEIYVQNYDLIILISFYLGIKTNENQNKIPSLVKLKNIYQEKFGTYSNKEIKESELIYIKIIEYNINFMTVYDFLVYIFKNKTNYIISHLNKLNKIIYQNSTDFCVRSPIELIQEITDNSEIYNLIRNPVIIQKKIIFKSRENSFGCELGNSIDESLSTSIGSGNQNFNIHKKEFSNIINYKKLELGNPCKNYTFRKRESFYNKPNKNFDLKYISSTSNSINNTKIIEHDIIGDMLVYNRKNIKDWKNKTIIKEKKMEIISPIYKTNIKEKGFRNNNNSTHIRGYILTVNDIFNNSSSKNVYIKPYVKKEENQKYFTSNKKKEIESKYISFKKLKNKNNENESKDNLRKKLFLEESDYK